jgi:hypothetical protein
MRPGSGILTGGERDSVVRLAESDEWNGRKNGRESRCCLNERWSVCYDPAKCMTSLRLPLPTE